MTLPSSLPEGREVDLIPRPSRWPASFLARLMPRLFRAELEEEYERWRHARALGSLRAMLIAGSIAFGSFTLWDYVVAPEQYGLLVPVRILGCTLTLVLLVCTYTLKLQQHMTGQLIGLIATGAVSVSLAWILNVVPDGWKLGLMGFAFSSVGLMTVTQARLMAINGVMVLLLANGSLWWQQTEAMMWISTNFFLVGLAALTYVLTFAFEVRERRLFALERQLEHLATVDALSGAWNRRAFTDRTDAELQRMRRYHRPVSFLLLDIDHFKKINDTFGHAVGDDAIRALCATCRQIMRQTDAFGRLGGEEFAVLLPETGLDGARHFAERLRAAIADLGLQVESHPEPLRFSISIGVTAARPDDTFDTLLQRADVALYQAKGTGRNRVMTEEMT